jgi:hypothetical protein
MDAADARDLLAHPQKRVPENRMPFPGLAEFRDEDPSC